jgi:hypothetical protein
MQLALDRLRETGEGRPGLGRAHVEDLARRLEQLRGVATTSDSLNQRLPAIDPA